ncbi:MAG: TonB-dependent receptor, partial [Acidobacteriota bacterium]|nr:TonB-dependent receptor [Acidobacteriota bacterium]
REVMIDGASLTIPESGGTVFNFPGFEAFNEMRLITSTYNAEYGRLGGGIELMVTKSGTNGLHGAAFLNMRRDIWDAAGWTSNSNPRNAPGFRAKERYNEEGGAIGGPVYIPKVYDGRNKTFFYFTYAKDVRPATISFQSPNDTLPTTLMKQGNFSEVSPIFDPATTTTANGVTTRQQFPGNIIPASRFSKVSNNIIPLIPDPNQAGVTGNYAFLNSSVHTDYIYSIKADHAITASNRASFFMTRESQVDNGIALLPGPLSNGLLAGQYPDNYRANDDWIFSPTLLLHSTFGVSRQRQHWNNPLQNGYGSKIGLPLTGDSDAFPIVNFETDALTNWGMNQGKVNNGGQFNTTIQFSQQLSWVRGKHELKFGWDIRSLRTIGQDLAGTNGSYSFSRAQTADPARLTTTGNAFASFLLGSADLGSATATPVTFAQIRYAYYAGFVQDTWRLTPKVTLDLGLRYEVPVGWHDKSGNYSSLDITKPNPGANNLPGSLIYGGSGTGRTGKTLLFPTDYSDIGPRVGVAYHPFNKTVIRGGFGMYYQTLGNGGCGCTDGFNGNFSQLSDGLNPAFNWDNKGVQPPSGFKAPPFLDPSFDNFSNAVFRTGPTFGVAPRVYNYSLTLQQEHKGFLFEAAYIGNRAHRLSSTIELNQLPVKNLALGSLLGKNIKDPAVVAAGYKEPFPGFAAGWVGGATLAQALRPYPQFGAIYDANAGVGKLWYDSFQAKIERRFSGLQLVGSYVFSKNLTLMHYRQIFSQSTQVQTQDAYNINDAKTLSPLDLTHVANLLTSFELPFGRGKKFLGSSGRIANLLVGGWIVSAAQQYRSGAPIEVVTPGNPLGAGELFSRVTKAVYTGHPIQTGVSRGSLDPNNPNVRWFNSGANSPFAVAAPYTLGNASLYYEDFRNPPFFNENISILKNFIITESVRLVYRADAINAFNRTDFGSINGTVGNVNFGRPQGVQDGPRIITMGVRLEF